MILDQNSLLIAIGIAASGLMTTLLIAWTGARQDKYLLCWGGGLALIVMAVLIYGLYSEPYVPALQFAAFELLISGFALTHIGAVLFRVGRVQPGGKMLLWALATSAMGLAFVTGYSGLGTIICNLACAFYFLMAGREFWLGRAEAPLAMWSQTVLYWATAISFALCAAVLIGNGQFVLTDRPSNWAEDINSLVIIVALAGIGALALAVNQMRATKAERRRALTDSLTGLMNRRALFDWADTLPVADGTAVVMLDLDNFKAINDSFGHARGDDVLVRFADIVRANLRPEDRAARLGGEEFCLVFQGMTPAEASALAERIRGALEATPPLSRAFGPPTVSAGVAIAFGGDDTFDTLLRRADTALYEAKQDGRNRVEGPTPRLVA
ncbi:MAG TPA: GGDEF domain-containing protein [Devosia sp.]